MARDPLHVSVPDREGTFSLGDGDGLYYELRGLQNNEGDKKAILVMGAFGTLHWLNHVADKLAVHGFQVSGASSTYYPPPR